MWPFRTRYRPPYHPGIVKPVNTFWTQDEIAAMSAAIRIHGQPDSEGWQEQALIVLNALIDEKIIEAVSVKISLALNPHKDPYSILT